MVCMSQPQNAKELLEELLQVHTHLSDGSISRNSKTSAGNVVGFQDLGIE